MNNQTLDLMIELQPVFEKYRGEWQVGDKVLFNSGLQGIVSGTQPHLLQISYVDGNFDYILSNIPFWLPQLYDDEQPERSLWGMVDWLEAELELDDDGTIRKRLTFAGYTPTLAVLRAIKEQVK